MNDDELFSIQEAVSSSSQQQFTLCNLSSSWHLPPNLSLKTVLLKLPTKLFVVIILYPGICLQSLLQQFAEFDKKLLLFVLDLDC